MIKKYIFASVFSAFVFGIGHPLKILGRKLSESHTFSESNTFWDRSLTGVKSIIASIIAPDIYSNNGVFGPSVDNGDGFYELSKILQASFYALLIVTPISILSLPAFTPATLAGFATVAGVVMGLSALEAGLKSLVGCVTPWYNILGRGAFKSIGISLYIYLATIPWAICILSVVAGAYMAYNAQYNSHIPGFIYAQPVASLYTALSMALASGYINGWALTLYLSVMLVVGWFIYDNKDKIIKQLFEMPFLKGKNKIIGGGLAISSIACISILVFCPNLVAIYIARVVLIIMLQVCNVVDSLSPRLLGAELASKVFDQLKQGDA